MSLNQAPEPYKARVPNQPPPTMPRAQNVRNPPAISGLPKANIDMPNPMSSLTCADQRTIAWPKPRNPNQSPAGPLTGRTQPNPLPFANNIQGPPPQNPLHSNANTCVTQPAYNSHNRQKETNPARDLVIPENPNTPYAPDNQACTPPPHPAETQSNTRYPTTRSTTRSANLRPSTRDAPGEAGEPEPPNT